MKRGGKREEEKKEKEKGKATSISLYAIISGANDFVHDKNHARKKLLLAVTIQEDDYK